MFNYLDQTSEYLHTEFEKISSLFGFMYHVPSESSLDQEFKTSELTKHGFIAAAF